MELNEIKNKEDLKKVLNFLDEQGFDPRGVQYVSVTNLHDKRVEDIFNKANKYNVDLSQEDKNMLYRLKSKDNYSDIKIESENYFSKYNPDDKINEVINWFFIRSDDSSEVPSFNNTSAKAIVDWVKFRNKYNLIDEFNQYSRVKFYNFDKPMIKIGFNDRKSWEFDKMYKLIYGEEVIKYKNSDTTSWQNLGKIEIKFFLNGNANLKGDLTLLKEYYYKYLIRKRYDNLIIRYNGKNEIFKKDESRD